MLGTTPTVLGTTSTVLGTTPNVLGGCLVLRVGKVEEWLSG